MEYSLNIALIEPEIPQNTGNIARTCAATGARLHLVGPMGFTITDKQVKRAGLDYWDKLDITFYDSQEEFFEKNKGEEMWFFSKKGSLAYTEPVYSKRVFIIFGKETTGLDEALLRENFDRTLRLPMREGRRSLNLSNSVAVSVYEILRQRDFSGLVLDPGIINSD